MTPHSSSFGAMNPLTMTIVVRPPILFMETFDWSDFPVIQRDPIYDSSCSSCYVDNNRKALHDEEEDSLPSLESIESYESDRSVVNTAVATESAAAATTHSSNSSNKRVTFADRVHIRRHSLVIGDHPCCSQLALELSWEHDEGEWEPLLEQRQDGSVGRRHTNTRRRSYLERKNLLKYIGGMTDEEIRQTTLRHAAPSIRDLSAMQGIAL